MKYTTNQKLIFILFNYLLFINFICMFLSKD